MCAAFREHCHFDRRSEIGHGAGMIKHVLLSAILASALLFPATITPARAQTDGVTQEKPIPAKPDASTEPLDETSGKSAKTKDAKPGPDTVEDRDRILGDLYKRLSEADSADYAKLVETAIEKMWSFSGSDTVDLLMRRAQSALGKKNEKVAVTILNSIVALDPKYAEGWNRRAFVHFSQKNYRAALRDLRRVLLIDPQHFKAIGGLAVILREYGRDGAALKAFRKAQEINPHDPTINKAVQDLEVEVEGQAI